MVINDQKRILVTGGGGYIGTHVVGQLLARNYKVRILDPLVFGQGVLKDLKKNKNLEIVQAEIGDLYQLSLALKDVNEIIHLAGLVGDPACALDKDFTIRMNILSTRVIKDLSKLFNIKKFIFASSCSVYGSTNKKANEESKLNPISLYAKTKIDSEKELLNDDTKNFHPVVLRLATVFGHSRRQRFDLIANLFTAQAHNDGVLTVTGSKQWRPFIHASDVARAFVMIVEAPLAKIDRQIINVGDDNLNCTIANLAQLIAGIVKTSKKGQKVQIIIQDDPADLRNYHVSFAKIHKILGYKAMVGLEQGIKEMYHNFKQGVYKGHYRDPIYVNYEMTKLMQMRYSCHAKS
ncbi:hypothetical protein A2686_01065 [Candidatus Woesebacteria bacterium RIFCSPHIGHO2_01_FULL_38_10]|uniref:NAD-dependent epimerase/dehydratase domain-containing protein n=1 Tax=Candidatus Woesebacteria bacterium RIFCSPLOWO2_01_FULL_39_10b TaxID=1802517 RepID=A0A1F8B5R6_9BACT|nr:MAG: hypothetical protein A2686_01065 [Candidatus Woesebacteria bacterium RIFCSPHIGHO2_01_FULL_38_10]OGM59393.1 MAG: hypothetical protein A2892_03515 [Candidatus Woesebacteria bacterium RIFCSPLOWO2_01_FULL_39_10b]